MTYVRVSCPNWSEMDRKIDTKDPNLGIIGGRAPFCKKYNQLIGTNDCASCTFLKELRKREAESKHQRKYR